MRGLARIVCFAASLTSALTWFAAQFLFMEAHAGTSKSNLMVHVLRDGVGILYAHGSFFPTWNLGTYPLNARPIFDEDVYPKRLAGFGWSGHGETPRIRIPFWFLTLFPAALVLHPWRRPRGLSRVRGFAVAPVAPPSSVPTLAGN